MNDPVWQYTVHMNSQRDILKKYSDASRIDMNASGIKMQKKPIFKKTEEPKEERPVSGGVCDFLAICENNWVGEFYCMQARRQQNNKYK